MNHPNVDTSPVWRYRILIIVLLSFALRLGVVLQPLEQIDAVAIPDDTYLALTIARNIAEGKGSVYGNEFTNGFQPLYVFLTVPIFLFEHTDDHLPVKAALILLTLFDTLALFLLIRLVSRISRSPMTPLLIGLAWTVNPLTIKASVNGLETAVASFFIIAILSTYHTYVNENGMITMRRSAVLGILFGLGILARIDTIILIAPLTGMIIWSGRRAMMPTVHTVSAVAAGIMITYGPWFLYSWIQSGDLFPVSGKAIRFMELERSGTFAAHGDWFLHTVNLGFNAVLENNIVIFFMTGVILFPVALSTSSFVSVLRKRGTPLVSMIIVGGALYGVLLFSTIHYWIRHGSADLFGMTILAAGGIIVTAILAQGTGLFQRMRQLRSLLLPLAVYSVTLFCAYTLYIFGVWFFDRYLHPLNIVFLIGAAILIDTGFSAVRTKRVRTAAAIVMASTIVVFNFLDDDFQRLYRTIDPNASGYMQIGIWADRTFPPGTVIGSCQSGALGYFAKDLTVINLDGVVNKSCYEALKQKQSLAYIRDSNIEYVIGWPLNFEFLDRLSAEPLYDGLTDGRLVEGITSWYGVWLVYAVR